MGHECVPGDMDTIIGKETWEKHFSRKPNKHPKQDTIELKVI